nr:filamentous hemagglutinin N-terminal domain-containing protein [Lelliottia sp. RWM.1]
MDNRHSVSFCRRFLSYAICAVIAGQPLLPAIGAAITPSGNAQMEQAGNGVPVVNIATPNGAGISHNQYGDYNVGKEGLILNNATGKLNQTQLGGLIQNNPNLKAGQEARGIINEVTGGKRSELKGYTEVAGKAANVMVANPYGITCDGCGFINTPQATLTTGKPVMSADGSLQALEVTKGSITINGAGLDASQSDAVSIIARATDINAQLHAKDLTVTTGANRVGADGSITPIKGEGVAPTVAIDTSALGGMYANRIRLASTERGVGVNLGNLNARQGDITLNAAGKLILKDSLATGNTTITATDVTLSGDNKTSGNLNVTGTNALMLNQTRLVADKHLTLSSSGLIAQNGGELTAAQNITLSGHALNQDNSGKTNASGNVTLSATGNAMMKGNTVAGKSLVVNTGSLSNSGILAAGTDAHVRTGELTHSGTLQGNTLNVIATDLTSTGGLKAGRSLDISARDITLSGQTISGDSLILKGNTLKTTATAQTQGNSVSVEVQNAQFDGTQAARDSLAIKTRGRLTHGGITQAQTLKTENDSLSNSGLLLATGDIHVLTQSVANTGTVAGNVLFINAEHINNNGLLQGDDSLNLTGRTLDLQAGSRTLTNGILSLSGTTLTSAGQIQGNGISVNAHDWQQGGSLLAKGALLASVTGTLNNTGELLSQNNATLNVAHIISSGRLLSAGDLAVTGNTLHNSGTVQGNNVALYQDRITNNGAITGVAALTLATRPDMASPFLSLVNNAKGSLLTAGDLSVTAGELNNTGQWQGKRVLVHAQKLTNSGALQAAELLDAQISNNLTGVTGSKITSNGEMALSALTLTNGGQWIAKNLALNANALTNSGEITGVDALSATLKQSLNNQTGGKLLSGGSLNLSAGSTTNAGQVRGASLTMNVSGELGNTAGAVLLSQDTLKLSSATLSNQGTIQGGGESSVEARTRIQNDGKLISGGKLTLGAPELMNNSNGLMQAVTLLLDVVNTVNGGRVLTSDRAELKGTTLTNNGTLQGADLLVNYRSFTSSGTALGTASLTVKGDSLSHTDSGKLYSAGNLLLDVRDFSGRGLVVALGDTTLKLINALSNNATLAAGKTLSVTSQNAVTNNRLMQGNSIVLNAGGEFVNNAQLTLGSGNSTFSAQHILQNTPGSLRAGGDVYLASRGNITVNGFTGTAGSLTMSAAGTLLNSTLIYAGHNL